MKELKEPRENGVQDGTLPHRGPPRRQMIHVSPPESRLLRHRLKMPSLTHPIALHVYVLIDGDVRSVDD